MNTKILARVGVAAGAVGVAAMLIACGSGGNSANGNDPTVSDTTLAIGSASASPTPAAAKPGTITDGQWGVGSQVKPGTYVTVVPADSSGCYWERESSADGSFDSIISNDNADPGQQSVVTIAATDKFFKASGCGTWTLQK